jgi:hypothetical protein
MISIVSMAAPGLGTFLRIALAAATLALAALAARAQDAFPPDRIPPGGQSWRIERLDDVPPRLVAALKQADCRQDAVMLSAFPIELFRPSAGSLVMAIAPCAGTAASGRVLSGRAFVLDRGADPRVLEFPVMAFPGRVSASELPGVLAWTPRTQTLVALQGNDECDGVVSRHTYRHDRRHEGDDLNGFALAKVERGKLGCGDSENWQVVWEAEAR